MFGIGSDASRIVSALSTSNAMIEFDLEGIILNANGNFLALMGYTLAEIKGKHHSIFVGEATRAAKAYRDFWSSLRKGGHFVAEYPQVTKSGAEVWIQGNYSPVLSNGKAYKVVKIASDITALRATRMQASRQIDALNRSQAVIEFTLDGTIVSANENFLKCLGYSMNEISGRHHSMFVDPAEVESDDYRRFWSELKSGAFQVRQFRRLAKGGREVWIQASYNPLFDEDGKVVGVVKFAADVTQARHKEREMLSQSARELEGKVGDVSKLLTLTNGQAKEMASSAHEVSSNVQALADSSVQLAASVSEINQQVTKALSISNDAVSQAEKAGGTVSSLVEDARKISAVVHLINSIAAQTNLLALNATIEAARAGDAGRGFAVVAGEVKALAAQTARATEEISEHIQAVQHSSNDMQSAIDAISATINEINAVSVSISAAVEEQAGLTGDMSQNMQQAAEGVDVITRGMEEVAVLTREADETVLRIADKAA